MGVVPKSNRRLQPCASRRFKFACGAAALFLLLSGKFALAQQSPAPTPSPQIDPLAASAPPVQTVTVTAHASGYRSTIDAKSYNLSNDLKNSTGSLADVLRDVPSVEVDIEGTVSLRGDSDVTILVDGKPSALFSGPGRAQAIQNISADQYERIEVMTNPSAAQTAEGSAGIINLISKHPKAGTASSVTGTLKAQVGSGDRYDLGATGAYVANGLSLNGALDVGRNGFSRTIGTTYGIPDPATGVLAPAYQSQNQHDYDNDINLHGSLAYDLDPVDHFDAGFGWENDREVLNQTLNYQTAAAAGPLALDYAAPGLFHGAYASTSESLGYVRTLPGDGQSLSIKLSLSQGQFTARNVADYSYTIPAQSSLYQDETRRSDFPQLDLKIDYKTTLPNKAKFTLGYEGKFDWQGETNQGAQGKTAALATADPTFAEHFTFDQQMHAVYATYEQTFGKLTVQPGLRLENTTLTTDLVTTGQTGRQAYLKAYPSLHIDFDMNDASNLKASYGVRVQRPTEGQLDPFRIENSPTSFSAGNPNLKPAITQSWELGYEYRKKTTDYQATLFYRDKTNVFTTVQEDIGGNALLSTSANLGHSQDAGLELVANRDLVPHLTLNTSADFRQSEVDAGNLGIGGTRTAFISSGRATVNWQAGANDFLQVGAQASGRQLTAQGYYGGAIFSDMGWRHKFGPRLAVVLTAQDPFGLSRRTVATETPDLVDVQKRKFNYSAVFLNLTYALGGAPKSAADNFDFGAHQPTN
jgi:outer membrane receptor protein involved in Fe transport